MNIAVLGGSFNPPHIGHLSLAEEVQRMFSYDTVLFIPAHVSPHKQMAICATDEDRVNMLRLALEPYKSFALEQCELERGGVSYTIDTVRYLKEKYAPLGLTGKIAIIIGDDLAEGFSHWRCAENLAQEAEIILARRDYSDAQDVPFLYPHKTIRNKLVLVSSSDIRSRIKNRMEWSSLVPNSVYRYITERHLYEY